MGEQAEQIASYGPVQMGSDVQVGAQVFDEMRDRMRTTQGDAQEVIDHTLITGIEHAITSGETEATLIRLLFSYLETRRDFGELIPDARGNSIMQRVDTPGNWPELVLGVWQMCQARRDYKDATKPMETEHSFLSPEIAAYIGTRRKAMGMTVATERDAPNEQMTISEVRAYIARSKFRMLTAISKAATKAKAIQNLSALFCSVERYLCHVPCEFDDMVLEHALSILELIRDPDKLDRANDLANALSDGREPPVKVTAEAVGATVEEERVAAEILRVKEEFLRIYNEYCTGAISPELGLRMIDAFTHILIALSDAGRRNSYAISALLDDLDNAQLEMSNAQEVIEEKAMLAQIEAEDLKTKLAEAGMRKQAMREIQKVKDRNACAHKRRLRVHN